MVSVMVYNCTLCVVLLMDLFILCVACLTVCVHLSVPSIGFVYVFVCRKLSPHLRV